MFSKTKHKGKKWFCKSCLQCFSSEIVLNCHKKDCLIINGGQNVKLEKAFIEFNNFNEMIPAHFKIYADFECLLKKVDSGIHNDCFSYTAKYQDHIPCSFAYKLVCVNDKYSKDVVLYRGKNAIYKFIQSIFNEYSYCRSVMKKDFNESLVMSVDEEEEFEKSEICWICGKLIENYKVRDHCHITGKYRGAAHWNCNINLKVSNKLVVIFHNLKGYDSHLIFKELSKFNCNVDVIPNGLEKYMSFTLGKNIVFIDSMLFMNSSLDKLVKNLNDFVYLSSVFSGEQLEFFRIFNSLKDCCISDEENLRACNSWKVFNIKNLGEYHEFYLKTDILLLCDAFEKFINVCFKNYGLDPCNYFSSPGLSWDPMLKMAGIKLEKISNIDVSKYRENKKKELEVEFHIFQKDILKVLGDYVLGCK